MIWRALIGGLWKPFAWLFGAAGLWLAGRRSASQAGKIKGLQSTIKSHGVRDEVENRIARERDARDRLRSDWSE